MVGLLRQLHLSLNEGFLSETLTSLLNLLADAPSALELSFYSDGARSLSHLAPRSRPWGGEAAYAIYLFNRMMLASLDSHLMLAIL